MAYKIYYILTGPCKLLFRQLALVSEITFGLNVYRVRQPDDMTLYEPRVVVPHCLCRGAALLCLEKITCIRSPAILA